MIPGEPLVAPPSWLRSCCLPPRSAILAPLVVQSLPRNHGHPYSALGEAFVGFAFPDEFVVSELQRECDAEGGWVAQPDAVETDAVHQEPCDRHFHAPDGENSVDRRPEYGAAATHEAAEHGGVPE